ncbi:hypothetical protein N9B73_11870 [Verrucomicrobiales bacterium]|jgi:glycine cleavage system regulatory protein|nr:hypothetical protein [Verrucomicrobiales bacterium]|tara:strand:- start:261 stop:776 length:516 start_codon:yes stop_codon:yes gene_type:complete
MHVIVSIIGPDRKGLVENLASVVSHASGNWEGSRMIRLAGQFSGMVQVALPSESMDELEAALSQLEEIGLKTSVVRANETAPSLIDATRTVLLEVVGSDRQGIVSEISKTLASEGASIVELATDCTDAPMSGERLFKTHARIEIPPEAGVSVLRELIESISDDLMVEMDVE